MQFFETTIGIIVGVGGVLSVASIGVLYVLGLVKGKKDNADDRLINILKETVDELERKVNKQTVDIENLTKKVDELERENSTLIEVLQGRDKNTLEFQKQMLDAVRIGMETNGLAKETSKKLGELIDIMGDHLKAVEHNQSKGL
jgi:hypothetical protein